MVRKMIMMLMIGLRKVRFMIKVIIITVNL